MQEGMGVDTLEEDAAWRRAKRQARSQRELYGHLVIYALVSAMLIAIDVAGGSGDTTFLGLDWAFWPIGGWGIGVVSHILLVFGSGSSWEQRKAVQLYEKERGQRMGQSE